MFLGQSFFATSQPSGEVLLQVRGQFQRTIQHMLLRKALPLQH